MTPTLPHQLGDGLILRHATIADGEPLATLEGEMLETRSDRQARVAASVRDLVTKPHPTFRPSDFVVVEENLTHRIVSAMCLISQTWTYDGIPFRVGRPELVVTAPDFRRRGLVRRQFDLIHSWSADRGELIQAITGIPNFYRQYGYEMTVNLGGGRSISRYDLPEAKDDEAVRYRLRLAHSGDVSFLAETYRQAARRYLMTSVRDEALWQHDLSGRSETSMAARSIRVVETASGEPVGYLIFNPVIENQRDLVVQAFELIPGLSWLEVTPPILHHLRKIGRSMAEQNGLADFERIFFALGPEHPVFKILEHLLGRTNPPYAWYIRVPDVPALLRVISPALDARLAESVAVGYTGTLKISRYVDGFEMRFERGRLIEISTFRPAVNDYDSAAFPGLTFLHLLFGYRTIEELHSVFTDCQVGGEYRVVLNALFPKKVSEVWPVE